MLQKIKIWLFFTATLTSPHPVLSKFNWICSQSLNLHDHVRMSMGEPSHLLWLSCLSFYFFCLPWVNTWLISFIGIISYKSSHKFFQMSHQICLKTILVFKWSNILATPQILFFWENSSLKFLIKYFFYTV